MLMLAKVIFPFHLLVLVELKYVFDGESGGNPIMEMDQMIVMKSEAEAEDEDQRQKEWIESRISLWDGVGHVPGIEPQRLLPLDGVGNYTDGQDCQTGQNPFNMTETRIIGPLLRHTFEKQQGLPFAAMYTPGMYEMYFSTSHLGPHCTSRVCTFDLQSFNYICGPLGRVAYSDGESCLDGSKPLTEVEFKATGIMRKLKIRPFARTIRGRTRMYEYNEQAQRLYGKNCKSGKCYYNFRRGNFICCASWSIKLANFLMLLPIVCLFVQ